MKVQNKVYDLTDFLPSIYDSHHPHLCTHTDPFDRSSWRKEGDPEKCGMCCLLFKKLPYELFQGKDSTADFDLIHSNDVLDKWLEPSKHLGDIDTSVAGMSANGTTQSKEPEQSKPKLSQCVNISDFESVAQQIMKKSSWNYYSTGAEDEFVS